MESGFFDSQIFQWGVLPFLIFLARMTDVTMDTLRIMLLSRGKKLLPPLIGFFQMLVWLFAIRQIFLNLSNWMCYISFAAGFGMGTFVGMMVEEKITIGVQVIKIITRMDASELVQFLMKRGYGVTSVEGDGSTGKVNIIYTIVNRKDIPPVLRSIKRFNPNAFYTIDDIRMINQGVISAQKRFLRQK